MKYRPARWIPPASHSTSVVCATCGVEHFSVFYISQILGVLQCENCLRTTSQPSQTSSS